MHLAGDIMKSCFLSIALVALGFAGTATAQLPARAFTGSGVYLRSEQPLPPPAHLEPSGIRPVALNWDYFGGYASDAGSVIGSVVRWRPSGWLKMSACVLAIARLAEDEDDLQAWVQSHRTQATDRIAGYAKYLGDGKYALPALGALYCYGRLLDSPRAQRTALLSLESVAIAGAFSGGLKFLSHKRRPASSDFEESQWDGPSLIAANRSFPSGHSTVAFAVATVIASQYGDHWIVPPLAYGAASMSALSRVNDNAHWASDVFVGSAIGYLTARTIVALHGDKSRMNLSILPDLHDKRADLAVSYRF
jgi:hypothetical protein